jgi:hypothetical protein
MCDLYQRNFELLSIRWRYEFGNLADLCISLSMPPCHILQDVAINRLRVLGR